MDEQAELKLPIELILDMLLRPETVPQSRIDVIDQPTWSLIVRRLRAHRALPYLHFALTEKTQRILPPKILQMLTISARLWGARQLMLGRECLIMHQALAAKNIPHLFLKGTPLAFGAYANARLRPAQDVDILVYEKDVYAARDCVIEQGGTPIDVYQDVPPELNPDAKHLAPIWSPNRILPVELHVRIFKRFAEHASPEMEGFAAGLWDNVTTFPVSDALLPTPGGQDMALHLISHSVYENFFSNGPLFLIDLQRLIESGLVDPLALHNRACQMGMGHGCALALKMLGRPIGGDTVTDQMVTAVSHLMLQNTAKDTKPLNLVRSFQIGGLRAVPALLGKIAPKKSHMIFLRREAGAVGGKDWSYLRLWFAMLRNHASNLKTLIRSGKGRSAARRLITVKSWLGAE